MAKSVIVNSNSSVSEKCSHHLTIHAYNTALFSNLQQLALKYPVVMKEQKIGSHALTRRSWYFASTLPNALPFARVTEPTRSCISPVET